MKTRKEKPPAGQHGGAERSAADLALDANSSTGPIDDGSVPPPWVYESDPLRYSNNEADKAGAAGEPAFPHPDPEPDDEPDEIEIVGDQQPLVPNDIYRVRFVRHETVYATPRRIPRLALRFEVIEGEHTGKALTCWRNTKDNGERTRIGAGANSNIATELRRVARQRDRKMANKRLTVAVLRNVDLAVRTRTTKPESPYSIVDEIVGLWDATAPDPLSNPHSGLPVGSPGESDGNGNSAANSTAATTVNLNHVPDTGYQVPDTSTPKRDGDRWLSDYWDVERRLRRDATRGNGHEPTPSERYRRAKEGE